MYVVLFPVQFTFEHFRTRDENVHVRVHVSDVVTVTQYNFAVACSVE